MHRSHRFSRRVAVSAPALAFVAALGASSSAAAATALPDSGLFAPVAAQQSQLRQEIAALRSQPPGPEIVSALLGSGRVDEAARLADSIRGDARAVARARATIQLARLDFAAAAPTIEAIAKRPDATDAERRLRLLWLYLHDDAPAVDGITRGISLARGTTAAMPELIAAGRLAYDMLNFDRADSCFSRALERAATDASGADPSLLRSIRAEALVGIGRVAYKRRDYDGSLTHLTEALAIEATPEGLRTLAETLIRLGRTDESISACEWAVAINPYHETAHYFLGNGYARKNYTQLAAAYPAAFADAAGRTSLAKADALLTAGDRAGARRAYESIRRAHTGWADVLVRLASLDFEEGRFASTRDLCFAALERCSEYGRAHATLAKALESQRFAVDVHRAGYEARFAAAAPPTVPGIETFVTNWKSLSPRHQKRVALSIAPWKQFIPVLVEGGATYYIKPLHQLLSESPGLETLKDQRINYDSRLWDDVRGCGGYHTVTGIEDVERTIFDRYNTVLHELSHQVHAVLTADQSRRIQDLYVQAKERDDATKNGYLSRYAGGSVYEYFAEGANALHSPKRDAFDPREEVSERLDAIDPALRELVRGYVAITDVSASYPVAYTNAGDDRVERGKVDEAVKWYERALARSPKEETALRSQTRALMLGNRGPQAVAAADQAMKVHAASGSVVAIAAEAYWHGGRGLDAARRALESARATVRPEDRYEVDLERARLSWIQGDAAGSLAACDSVLAYQSDHPEGLWNRAAALALASRWDEAFAVYDRAVRMRTGVAGLRCDYARDLLRAGRTDDARTQLAEAKLLDEENPTAEALRGWAAMNSGDSEGARRHFDQALAWGPWCDLGRILLGRLEHKTGRATEAKAAWAPVRERIEKALPPEYVYREGLATWESVHELPAVERELLEGSPAK